MIVLGSRLQAADVGHRVVVRRRLDDGRPMYTDILGELIELTENELVVRGKHGEVRVPLADVHRAKRVPERARRPSGESAARSRSAADPPL